MSKYNEDQLRIFDIMAKNERHIDDWCNCKKEGNMIFFPDGVFDKLKKHHYRCDNPDCGRIQQIG